MYVSESRAEGASPLALGRRSGGHGDEDGHGNEDSHGDEPREVPAGWARAHERRRYERPAAAPLPVRDSLVTLSRSGERRAYAATP